MKTIFLHGLGQTARAWNETVKRAALPDAVCPELFSHSEGGVLYQQILKRLETLFEAESEPVRLCGLSLGATLALDFAARHPDKTASLILIAPQYKTPTFLIDFQNALFRCMPEKTFESMGLSKKDTIGLTRSMRSLDLSGELHKVRCPVTILCGAKDGANQKAARALVKLLPRAELRIVPGAGHELNVDAPEAIAELVRLSK